MARIEKGSFLPIPRPKGPMPTAEEIVLRMDEAGRAPWVVAEIKRLAELRQIDQEMADYRREARGYDPVPEKKLILGKRTTIRKAA